MVGFIFKSPIFFCIIILFTYLIGLWGTSVPLTGDQKVYLSIALEMFEKKEWLIPSLFGEANFLKPPFQYWATIVGWKIFGLSVFGALIPSVLALLSNSYLCFQIAKKIKLKSPALAAILFASTIGSMTYGSTAQMEIWIVLFFQAAWLATLHSKIFLTFILVGIMAWVKGPLYPVLWTISLLVWNLGLLKNLKFWVSLLLGTFIGLGWYLVAAKTHLHEILNQFLYAENLGKIGTNHGSIIGLWGEFIFSLFPWGVLLIIGCFQKQTRDAWKINQRFYLSYSLVSVIFFTLFPYRVYSYLYFLTPLIAMMASEIDLNFKPWIKKLGIGIYGIVFSLVFFLTYKLTQGGWLGMEIPLSFLFASLVFIVGFLHAEWKYVALTSLIMVNLVRVSAVQIGEKDIAGLKDIYFQNPGDYAFYIDSRDIWHEFGLVSVSLGSSVQRIYNKTDLDSFLAHRGSVIFQSEQQFQDIKNINCKDWKRLKRRTKFPIEKIINNHINWGDEELMRTYHVCTVGQ